jgi:hypothetical protein
MDRDENTELWVVIDTGFGRYLGRVVDGFGYRNGKPVPVKDSPVGLVGKPEVVLDRVMRFEILNLPTRDGIVPLAVRSSPVPWVPVFSPEARVRVLLDRIVWYDIVPEEAVVALRRDQLEGEGAT